MNAFTFFNYKNIKIGDTDIKKVKYGGSLLWPVPGFILYRNGIYYEVSGIENNLYITTQYVTNAPLVNITDMMFELNIPVQPKIIFEYCICGFDGVLLNDGRLTKSDSGTATIHNNKTTNILTWRYMGSSSAGTGSLSLNNSATPIRDIVCNSLTQNDYLCQFMLEPYPNATNRYYKRLYKSTFPNGTPAVIGSNTTSVYDLKDTYIAQYMEGYTWKIGDINDICQRSNGKKFWCNFYYLKMIDYDTSAVVGLYYFKNDNDTLKLYDHVSNSFLTSTSGTNASLTKLNKSIEIPGLTPNDYYYVDGTIEINGVTYEKLVNNLDSTKIKKGIQISGTVTPTLVNPVITFDELDYSINMSCSTSGALIYYTIEGSAPSDYITEPILYEEPIDGFDLWDEMDANGYYIIKAQSYLNGTWSEVVEFDMSEL